MIWLRKFLKNTQGSYVTLFVVLIALFSFTLLVSEYMRFIDHREEVESIIQRSLNVSMEFTLRDAVRRDHETMINTTALWQQFDQYLRADTASVSGSYPRYTKTALDGSVIWRIEFTSRSAPSGYDPYGIVTGNIFISPRLELIRGEIAFPFSIRSRSRRIE